MNRATCRGAKWKEMPPTRGISLAALIVLSTALAIIALMLTIGSATPPVIAQTPTSCANTVAIPDPEDSDLVSDCNVLLAAAAQLTDTTGLNWATSRVITAWHGITVSMTRVTGLDLSDRNLTGTIPAALGTLTNLQTLSLYSNQLTGNIPAALGDLSNLQTLSLYSNTLTGGIPAELGKLVSLTHLYLRGNTLSGCVPHVNSRSTLISDTASLPGQSSCTVCANSIAIPGTQAEEVENLVAECNTLLNDVKDTLRGTASLNWSTTRPIGSWQWVTLGPGPTTYSYVQRLDLHGRGFNGTIPPELGNLSNLQILYLATNYLTGTIPAELGNLSELRHLGFHTNRRDGNSGLTGEIPPQLGNLSKLTHLWFNTNRLTGEIPEELGQLTNLQTLELWENNLTGTIPAALGNLTKLTSFLLRNNQLTGEIPPQLGNLTNVTEFNLSNNRLTGRIPPELGNLTKTPVLRLNNNQLTGEIPPQLGNLAGLTNLYLNNNQLTGEIPPQLGNLTRLRNLYLNNNRLTGRIPPQLGNLTDLAHLYLNDNQLMGTIPIELDKLIAHDLEKFYVRQSPPNQLQLTCIPPLIRNWIIPRNRDFSNDIPTCTSCANTLAIPNPENMHENLRYECETLLNYVKDTLRGSANLNWATTVPIASWDGITLGAMPYTSVQTLSISNTLAGTIPVDLDRIRQLRTLELNSNQLMGNIPPELGNLA